MLTLFLTALEGSIYSSLVNTAPLEIIRRRRRDGRRRRSTKQSSACWVKVKVSKIWTIPPSNMLRACLRSANATAPVRRTRCCHLSTLLAASLGERCGVCEYVANGKASYKKIKMYLYFRLPG